MKLKLAWLSFGLACLVAGTAPVTAADIDNGDAGGMKDSIYDGVPVPAPAPSPLYDAQWYVRADFGYTMSTDGDVRQENTVGVSPLLLRQLDENNGPAAFSVGFGRYFSSNFRVEFGIDIRNDQKVANGGVSTTDLITEQGINVIESVPIDALDGSITVLERTVHTTDTHYFDKNRVEEARIGNYTAMANVYYDFNNDSRFTPYVGAGAGIVLHTLKRKFSEHAVCTNSVNSYPTYGSYGTCIAEVQEYNLQGGKVANAYGLAASVMAGVSFNIRPNIILDAGYRFMWQGASTSITAQTFNGQSKIWVGERSDHDIRAGLRWNIN